MQIQKLKRADLIFSQDVDPKDIVKEIFKKSNDFIIEELINSGLKGRGGAGFPTGLKWKFAADEKSEEKYVICNADEGEPGTFKDREIIDKVAGKVLCGMAVCARVIGAKKGYIYLRGEYNFLIKNLSKEIDKYHQFFQEIGLDFNIEIFSGSGAYVCGEETALLESMEGKRGEPRNKPPFPAKEGYRGKPTVINNVETLVSSLIVCQIGADEYKKIGEGGSEGSKLFSISGDSNKEGIYELELGMNLRDFVDEFGDDDTKAVQVGGASGFCVPRKNFKDTTIGFKGGLSGENLPTGGSMMLFNSSRSMFNVLKNYLDFFEEESCGQCTPCRVGCQQLNKGTDAVKKGEKSAEYLNTLLNLAETMKITSKCGLGQSVANSFSSIVQNFREEMIY